MSNKVLLTRSSALSSGLPAVPNELDYGELAINYHSGKETLFIQNNNDEIVSFSSDDTIINYIDSRLELSLTYQMSSLLNDNLLLSPGDTYEEAFGKLEKAIFDNEIIISSALNDLNTRLNLKADSATTLAGYGITDAKIESGVITLGSNTITPLTSHQDISGKANTSEMSVSTSGDKTTITLKTGTSATVLNAHQDISGKANSSDLATVATTGSYTDLVDAPLYVICTQSQYDAMASHDADTYYIILADNNA